MTFVEKFNLEGELKKLTRGKAFFLPSVSTLQLKFKSMGLEKNYGTLDFTKYKLGPHRRSQFLRWVQLRLVRSRDTFAKMLDKQAGLKLGDCQFVEGASLLKNNQIFVDRPSNCSEPHFDIFTEAQGRTVGDSGIREWVGKGYNVLKGDPLGQKSGDPGFANSPFTIEGPSAYTWQTGQKSCRQSIDTSVTKSTKELQSEMGVCLLQENHFLFQQCLTGIPRIRLTIACLMTNRSQKYRGRCELRDRCFQGFVIVGELF